MSKGSAVPFVEHFMISSDEIILNQSGNILKNQVMPVLCECYLSE